MSRRDLRTAGRAFVKSPIQRNISSGETRGKAKRNRERNRRSRDHPHVFAGGRDSTIRSLIVAEADTRNITVRPSPSIHRFRKGCITANGGSSTSPRARLGLPFGRTDPSFKGQSNPPCYLGWNLTPCLSSRTSASSCN